MANTKAKNFRPLSELNLMDNFLFHEMIADKESGEEFCRILLKTFLNKEVRHVKIIPQKDIYGLDTDMHGIRMDAYLEDIGDSDAVDADILPDIYDIEPNLTYEKDSIPKRMRFYQGMIDAANLQKGKAYTSLPNVVIIFILPYDPFGGDRMVYTIQNMIKEAPSIDYNDGALKMILYTKGKAGNASKELQDMLKYFESSTATNVVNSDIEFVHHMVDRIKERRETNIDYMKSWEWDEYNKKLGRDEGMIAGREEGLAVGREEGLAVGREEGLAVGREEGRIAGRTEGIEIGQEKGIFAFIKACYKLHCSDEYIISELMSNFSLSQEMAQSYFDQFNKTS